MQLNVEMLLPDRVRFVGATPDMGMLVDGLEVIRHGAEAAAAEGKPHRYTPDQATAALEVWQSATVNLGGNTYAHTVPVIVAEMAYHGVKAAYHTVLGNRAANGEAGTGPLQERSVRLKRMLQWLDPIRAMIEERDS